MTAYYGLQARSGRKKSKEFVEGARRFPKTLSYHTNMNETLTQEELGLEDLQDRKNVTDEADHEEQAAQVRYSITSYGADPDVEGLIKRLRNGQIHIPVFQREYIWSIKEASRFIESLLLGLPVPGVFLAKEDESNKLLVIDGQQRLKSLLFFYDGVFNPKKGEAKQQVFKLEDVQQSLEGCTYKSLHEKDRNQLDNAIIHATIIKQDSPENDDTSIYHIFERLNSGGRRLTQQEIRTAASHGALIELLKTLNKRPEWRNIYGNPSPRLKDQELILRFFAFYFSVADYERPMSEFLNRFSAKNRHIDVPTQKQWTELFATMVNAVWEALGESAFRPERSLNTAVFDSISVGVARRLATGAVSAAGLKSAYDALLQNEEFKHATSRATADNTNVVNRLDLATAAFASAQ